MVTYPVTFPRRRRGSYRLSLHLYRCFASSLSLENATPPSRPPSNPNYPRHFDPLPDPAPGESMPDAIPACFRGGAPAGPPPSTAEGPSLTTSVYDTRLGLAALTWSRTVLGLSLRAVLRLDDEQADEDDEEEPLRFRIRPWLLWKRRGTRRFHFKDCRGLRRSVDFAWDLTRASFPPGGGPEPAARYFVAVSVDGEMLLVAGDLTEEAYKKTKAQRPPACPALISRLEHVVMGDLGDGRRSYRTRARLGGREREISIELGAKDKGKEVAMSVGVDGDRVMHVRRLRWKFRGSERVELASGGGRIQFSWDLHNWFFQPKDDAAAPSIGVAVATGAAELGHAVFMLRFQGLEKLPQTEEHSVNSMYKKLVTDGSNGKSRNINWSWSSSFGGGERKRGRSKRSMRKTSSSSSTSSASSASSSSVMEWASPEEMELQRAQGFSLLVYAWKS
ncbi:hypothetical protein Cni_G15165 [Canna indica]|uniref:DUF868 family protein n=1 Tax=Canna indica TaxID=4628 RepID=A0AAQ3KJ28_9LILI|nr:hypothetical protein Cni_G15165 [Canna indica]